METQTETQKLSEHLPSFQPMEPQSSSTQCKVEWLLTKEEEAAVWEHAVRMEKSWFANRLKNLHYTEIQIEQKLSSINFEERLNKHKILNAANDSKNQQIWHESQRERRRMELEKRKADVKAKYNKEFLRGMLESYAVTHSEYKKLIVNCDTSPLIEILLNFFTEAPEFEQAGYSHQKGLFIRGISGLGKTFLLEALKDNLLNPLNIVNMGDIEEELKVKGSFSVSLSKTIVIDDIGTESVPIKFFGTEVNWFKGFIEKTSRNPELWRRIIITTNISSREIEDRYSGRVRSRIRQMFNVIDVTGKDLRGRS